MVRQALRRYQLDGDLQKGDASLTIHNTTQKDSGRYGCRVHIPGLFNDEKNVVDLVIMKGTYPLQQPQFQYTYLLHLEMIVHCYY